MQPALVDAFCHSLTASNHADTTIKTYRHLLYRFERDQIDSGSTLLAATEREIEQWMVRLKTGSNLSNLTIRSYLVGIKQFFKWAERKALISRSPAQHLSFGARPKIPRLPDMQLVMDLLYAPVEPLPLPRRNRAMQLLLASSGCRISEACGMTLGDLDLTRGEFRVTGKGDKERICYLSGAPLEAVTEYVYVYRKQLAPTTEHVWISSRGAPSKPAAFRESLDLRAVAAGFGKTTYPSGRRRSDLTPHKLRHLFATSIYLAGADLMTIKNLLGHESVATTQIYTHIGGAQLRRAHNLFPGNLTPPPTNPRIEAIGGGAGSTSTTTGGRSEYTTPPIFSNLPKNLIPFRVPA